MQETLGSCVLISATVGIREGPDEEAIVKVTMLVSTCDIKDCPTSYATDRDTLLVQG